MALWRHCGKVLGRGRHSVGISKCILSFALFRKQLRTKVEPKPQPPPRFARRVPHDSHVALKVVWVFAPTRFCFCFAPPRWFHTCRYYQDIHTYVCIHPPQRSFSALGWCNTPSFTIATLDVFLFMAGSVPKDLGIRVRNLSRKVLISRRNENKAKWIFNVSPKLWYFKVVRKVLNRHFELYWAIFN